ncbi:hypothetical protein KBA73_02465 [Patescibacteria group bacterium]|nr:hypothetical protein [Patescibacteria group bacterium]
MANLLGERWSRLSTQQKFSASILGVCGGVALLLSLAQVRSQILSPFFVQRSVLDQTDAFFKNQEQEAQQLEALKKKDTDRDGLSDYDESYIYHTSAYLADTDGDNVPDGEEVARGINPNCPEGKTCNDTQMLVSTTDTSTLQVPGSTTLPSLGGTVASSTGASANVSASDLRNFLRTQSLLSETQLSAIPDDILVQVYGNLYDQRQTFQDTATVSSTTAAPAPSRSSTSTN